jgi:hypothetical protein
LASDCGTPGSVVSPFPQLIARASLHLTHLTDLT